MFDSHLVASLSKLNRKSKTEIIRYELYSIYSTLLLSKEYFIKNIDIKDFLSKSNINFKNYVFLSRTQILARVIREIERADENTLFLLLDQVKQVVFEKSYSYKEKSPDKEKENYIDSLMHQFGRGK